MKRTQNIRNLAFYIVILAMMCLVLSARIQANTRDNIVLPIPFSYSPPARFLMTVQVKINGSRPLTFIVDTGSEATLIVRPHIAKELKLPLTGETVTVSPSITGQATAKCSVELQAQSPCPNVSFGLESAWVAELSLLKHYPDTSVAGILGGEFFTTVSTQFDFDNSVLNVYPDAVPQPPANTPSITLPFVKTKAKLPLFVPVSFPNAPDVPLIIDTGSNSTMLPPAMIKKLTRYDQASIQQENMFAQIETREVLTSWLKLGDSIINLVTVVEDSNQKKALLGLDILSSYKCTLDIKRNMLVLEPRANFQRRLPGHVGFTIQTDGKNVIVSNVLSEQLLQAGIIPGDKIIEIDGQKTEKWSWFETAYRLEDYEQTTASLVFQKNDARKVSTTITRRSRFSHLIRGLFGITLVTSARNSAKIVDVSAKSEAERIGLKIEDEVVGINDYRVKDMSNQEIREHLDAKEATKKVVKIVIKKKGHNNEMTMSISDGKIEIP